MRIVLAFVLGCILAACSYTPGDPTPAEPQGFDEAPVADIDATLAGSRGIFDDLVEDSLDVAVGDLVDWKYMEIRSTGTYNLRVVFGPSTIVAVVSLYDDYADLPAEEQVEGGEREIVFEGFQLNPGRYYVRFAALEGAASYTIEREWAFTADIGPIPQDLRTQMMGTSHREGCPIDIDELSLLRVSHWTTGGQVLEGELVVASEQAAALAGVFEELFDGGFVIERMRPVSEYGGSDDASMADNNTSAFNCRYVTGTSRWSEHSYGQAIDINPLWNPYVRDDVVLPPGGAAFVERDPNRPGLIVDGDLAVTAFAAIGWEWGGDWSSPKDYQHFSATGR